MVLTDLRPDKPQWTLAYGWRRYDSTINIVMVIMIIIIIIIIIITWRLFLRVSVSILIHALQFRIGDTSITQTPLQMFWWFVSAICELK